MVTMTAAERKIPYTVFEHKINDMIFQFVCPTDSPYEHCVESMQEFRNHIDEIKRQMDQKAAEQKKESEAS